MTILKLRGYFCLIDDARRLIFQSIGDEVPWPPAIDRPASAPQRIPESRAKLIRVGYTSAIYGKQFAVHLPAWAKDHHYKEFAADVGRDCEVEVELKKYYIDGVAGIKLVLLSLLPAATAHSNIGFANLLAPH